MVVEEEEEPPLSAGPRALATLSELNLQELSTEELKAAQSLLDQKRAEIDRALAAKTAANAPTSTKAKRKK